jgi:hypothetical protein
MESNSQFTAPVLVDPCAPNPQVLKLLPFEGVGSGGYDERWLQDLLYAHPGLIPIEEVEPVFDGAVAVCRELPTAVGPLDLVFVNDQGLMTLVECKLWRNPEARRKVVGQILDYAQEISRWTYDDLNAAIVKAEARTGSSLWEIGRAKFNLKDEAAFIDRVSRHLRNGSFLLLIVGDGIRENTENIAAFLQKHAGLSFAFGLVEERLFQMPGSQQILVQPRILAKTVEIGRFIVRAETGAVVTEDVEVLSPSGSSPARSKTARTLTESILIEEVAGNSSLADDLRRLFQRIKDEGFDLVPTERGGSLKVVPPGTGLNLMAFRRDGTVANVCGQAEIGLWYLHELAKLLTSSYVREFEDKKSCRIMHLNDTWVRIDEIVAIQDQWINLIKQVLSQLNKSDIAF